MMRVDNVPIYWQPLFRLYGWIVGGWFYLYLRFITATCQIRVVGALPQSNKATIFCIWHQDLVPYFIQFLHVEKQIWMNHPAWYMKPVHVLLKLTGVEHICLGSSGNGGKAALQQVISYIRQGYSTTVACDGPAGPAYVLKPGVLKMSAETGVGITALRFECNRCIRLSGWDKKKVPLPFSTINVHIAENVTVHHDTESLATERITNFLNG